VDEFEIIRRYFERQTIDDSVLVGIGDDGALTRPAAGRDLVTVIDTLVAGVHFPQSLDPADIGYRAVAVNLSDIAAMAATPRWMTLALTMQYAEPAWLEGFSNGLFDAAMEHSVTLVGGDTTRGPETVVTVQITGDVRIDAALLRSGAAAGDSIYVTGSIGDAAAGLSVLQSGSPRTDDIDFLVHRFARPQARVTAGKAIAAIASAAIDLSDGLFTDVAKLLSASQVSGNIEVRQIPLSSQLSNTMAPADALRFALGGGDDYELCFTSAASRADIDQIAGELDVPVTCIGIVAEGEGLTCTDVGRAYDYASDGYRHFRRVRQ
jgi:thiamine-monophosphate kinase